MTVGQSVDLLGRKQPDRKMMRNSILCLGGEENTLGLARYMSRFGLKTVYCDSRRTVASSSKHVVFWKLPCGSDADLLQRFARLGMGLDGHKHLLFFNSDRFVKFGNTQRESLAERFDFMIPDARIVECALDKSRMSEIFPKELLADNFPVETHGDLISINQPLMVKPKNTSEPMPFKTAILSTPAEIERFGRKYERQLTRFLFQELVGGPESRLVSIFFYRSPRGEVYTLSIERERMIPYWGGIGCLIQSTHCQSAMSIEKALSIMRYVGLGEVDVCETHDRTTVFDLNVRLPSWAFFAEKCGMDLIGLYSRDVLNGNYGVKVVSAGAPGGDVKAIDLINDIITVFHPKEGALVNGVLTPWQYLKSLRGVRHFYILSFKDLGPFLFRLGTTLKHLLARIKSVILAGVLERRWE
jgi:predicted ATP-grasp superfamily ATP-dependent carboligase